MLGLFVSGIQGAGGGDRDGDRGRRIAAAIDQGDLHDTGTAAGDESGHGLHGDPLHGTRTLDLERMPRVPIRRHGLSQHVDVQPKIRAHIRGRRQAPHPRHASVRNARREPAVDDPEMLLLEDVSGAVEREGVGRRCVPARRRAPAGAISAVAETIAGIRRVMRLCSISRVAPVRCPAISPVTASRARDSSSSQARGLRLPGRQLGGGLLGVEPRILGPPRSTPCRRT